MRLHRWRFAFPVIIICSILVFSYGAFAAKNITEFELQFKPTIALELVAGFDQVREVFEGPLSLVVEDARRSVDPKGIGTRTDDGDRLHALTATNEVAQYVQNAVEGASRGRGVEIVSQATEVLIIKLMTFEVVETNQAMGASYDAVVHLQAGRGDDTSSWTASGRGTASRYGKKFSSANCNEVLSDALLEALDAVYRAYGAHRKNPAGNKPSEPMVRDESDEESYQEASEREVISPEKMLSEIGLLLEKKFESELIVKFLQGKALERPLEADDLISWREAGVQGEIIEAALELPVVPKSNEEVGIDPPQ